MQCGIMYTAGLDDEILMIVPFVLVPVQIYCINTITNRAPFIVKESVSGYSSFLFPFLTAENICDKVQTICNFLNVYAVHVSKHSRVRIERAKVVRL